MQEKGSIYWQVKTSVIVKKKKDNLNTRTILNAHRDTAV
jgi:hypothetical protein